jgi:hypothetical protein
VFFRGQDTPLTRISVAETMIKAAFVIDQAMTSLLESVFKWLFVCSLLLLGVTLFHKDRFPEPGELDLARLGPPLQTPTNRPVLTVSVRDQDYRITPRFDYELFGMVVSYSDADALKNIWHHKSWKDFINVRDLCLVWGENVSSGVYRDLLFRNDSWTCWVAWSEPEVGSRFEMRAISNNHLLTDDPEVITALMALERGDQVRLKGVLADYVNLGNGFRRETSVTREDGGNGACETVYLDEIELIRKANPVMRRLHSFAGWLALVSGIGILIMLPIAPLRLEQRR